MGYYVSRQVYWPEGQHVVEIAPGFDHASPGQLVEHYKAQGEGKEFDDPIEAAEAAILVRRAWQKDSKKRIGLTFGDADIGWGAHTQKELLAWADKMHEKTPKCDQCGEVLGSKRGDVWQHQDFPDEKFCSERCIEKMLEASAKLNEEFEPNAKRKAVGILGDVNYLDYGGMVVYDDGSVDLVEPDQEDEEGLTTVYRFDLEPFTRASLEREWFGERLSDVARTIGTTKADLVERLTSADLLTRASGYADLIAYVGVREFDQDPLTLSRAEAEKRYKGIDRGTLKPNIGHGNTAIQQNENLFQDDDGKWVAEWRDANGSWRTLGTRISRSSAFRLLVNERSRTSYHLNVRLKSSTATKAIEKLVRSAAAEKFGRGQAVPVFEHDRWWVDVDGALYAVVDARPGVGGTGLDFEAL